MMRISKFEIWEKKLPAKPPVISGVKARYKAGEVLHGNCSSHSSRPAANLTWIINGVLAKSHQLIQYPAIQENLERQTTRLGLRITVDNRHFASGRLKIRCSASIGSLYWQSTEKSVEEDRPRQSLPTTPPSSLGVQDDFGDLNRKWPSGGLYPPVEEETAQVATVSASRASLHTPAGWLLTLLYMCRVLTVR
ncbi:hypothetical protein B566_EDAN005446 [Ephemera danica]|nr:hypothetical protein B566_EDAN005446 [Ephemera danica]